MDSFVYIMANHHNTTIYVGITSHLQKRVWEHKSGIDKRSFTYKYNCHKLVYFEQFGDIHSAIAREKQIKRWTRERKNKMIGRSNLGWDDLAADWEGF